jgi:hypothetical protein
VAHAAPFTFIYTKSDFHLKIGINYLLKGMLMKKISLIILFMLLFSGVVTASSINGDYEGHPIVKIMSDGKQLETDEVPGFIYNGHTLVPISTLRQLGASVTWNENDYSVNVKIPTVTESTYSAPASSDLVKAAQFYKSIMAVNNKLAYATFVMAWGNSGDTVPKEHVDAINPDKFLENEVLKASKYGISMFDGDRLQYIVDDINDAKYYLASKDYVKASESLGNATKSMQKLQAAYDQYIDKYSK